jgi:hypothetical protein
MPLSPAQRTLRARLAAHALHAQRDSRELTLPARTAFFQRFLDEVDPNRVLPEPERLKRAASARKAYYSRLALKSCQARAKKSKKNAARGPVPAANLEGRCDRSTLPE